MVLNRKDQNECVKQFVKSFVWKNRQERLIEMINNNNWRKFTEEIFIKPGEHYLDTYVCVFLKNSITLNELTEVCPQIAKVKECCVIDYQRESVYNIKIKNLLVDLDEYFENTCILSFVPGEIAVYCSEYKALCCHMKGFDGILYTHPKFMNIIDKKIYKK